MVETTFTLTLRELTSALRLSGLTACFRLRTLFWVVGSIATAVLVVFVITRFDPRPPSASGFVLSFFGVCAAYIWFCVALHWWYRPFDARWQMRTSKELGQTMQCKGDDAGWHVRIDATTSDRSWGSYVKWSENADILLIYMNGTTFQIIPKRALAGPHDADRIRAWLIDAGVPRAAPLR